MSRRNGKYQCFSFNAENTKTTKKRMRSTKNLGLACNLFAETARKFGCSKSTANSIYKNNKLTRLPKIQRMVGQGRPTFGWA